MIHKINVSEGLDLTLPVRVPMDGDTIINASVSMFTTGGSTFNYDLPIEEFDEIIDNEFFVYNVTIPNEVLSQMYQGQLKHKLTYCYILNGIHFDSSLNHSWDWWIINNINETPELDELNEALKEEATKRKIADDLHENQINELSGKLNSIPLCECDMSQYPTKSELEQILSGYVVGDGCDCDLSNYATKGELDPIKQRLDNIEHLEGILQSVSYTFYGNNELDLSDITQYINLSDYLRKDGYVCCRIDYISTAVYGLYLQSAHSIQNWDLKEPIMKFNKTSMNDEVEGKCYDPRICVVNGKTPTILSTLSNYNRINETDIKPSTGDIVKIYMRYPSTLEDGYWKFSELSDRVDMYMTCRIKNEFSTQTLKHKLLTLTFFNYDPLYSDKQPMSNEEFKNKVESL